MGEIADDLIERYGYPDEDGPPKPEDYLDMTDEEMVKASSFVRTDKLKGIRKWQMLGNKLSDKQRWCLAFALCNRDSLYA